MARDASDSLKHVLADGSFSIELLIDAFDATGERTLQSLQADTWSLEWDLDAELKSGGSMRIVQTSDTGEALAPRLESDPLAPYGQEVNLLAEVSAGAFSETVQLGYFRIAEVPKALESFADFAGRTIVTASAVELTLSDRLDHVKRRGFRSEENPATTSAWDELARITGMQVIRSLPDATVPTGLVYQATRGGRLAAVYQLAAALGGVPLTTAEGALTVLAYTPGDVVGQLLLGEEGTITGDDGGMDSTEVYNVVVGDFETVDRIPIHKVAIAGGALSPELVPENTWYFSDDTVQTDAAAALAVTAELARRTRPAKRITVDCIVDPLLEVGDVRTVQRRDGSTLTAQAVKVSLAGGSAQMKVEMDVIDDGA